MQLFHKSRNVLQYSHHNFGMFGEERLFANNKF